MRLGAHPLWSIPWLLLLLLHLGTCASAALPLNHSRTRRDCPGLQSCSSTSCFANCAVQNLANAGATECSSWSAQPCATRGNALSQWCANDFPVTPYAVEEEEGLSVVPMCVKELGGCLSSQTCAAPANLGDQEYSIPVDQASGNVTYTFDMLQSLEHDVIFPLNTPNGGGPTLDEWFQVFYSAPGSAILLNFPPEQEVGVIVVPSIGATVLDSIDIVFDAPVAGDNWYSILGAETGALDEASFVQIAMGNLKVTHVATQQRIKLEVANALPFTAYQLHFYKPVNLLIREIRFQARGCRFSWPPGAVSASCPDGVVVNMNDFCTSTQANGTCTVWRCTPTYLMPLSQYPVFNLNAIPLINSPPNHICRAVEGGHESFPCARPGTLFEGGVIESLGHVGFLNFFGLGSQSQSRAGLLEVTVPATSAQIPISAPLPPLLTISPTLTNLTVNLMPDGNLVVSFSSPLFSLNTWQTNSWQAFPPPGGSYYFLIHHTTLLVFSRWMDPQLGERRSLIWSSAPLGGRFSFESTICPATTTTTTTTTVPTTTTTTTTTTTVPTTTNTATSTTRTTTRTTTFTTTTVPTTVSTTTTTTTITTTGATSTATTASTATTSTTITTTTSTGPTTPAVTTIPTTGTTTITTTTSTATSVSTGTTSTMATTSTNAGITATTTTTTVTTTTAITTTTITTTTAATSVTTTTNTATTTTNTATTTIATTAITTTASTTTTTTHTTLTTTTNTATSATSTTTTITTTTSTTATTTAATTTTNTGTTSTTHLNITGGGAGTSTTATTITTTTNTATTTTNTSTTATTIATTSTNISTTPVPSANTSSSSGIDLGIIIAAAVAGLLLCCLIAACCYFQRRRKQNRKINLPGEGPDVFIHSNPLFSSSDSIQNGKVPLHVNALYESSLDPSSDHPHQPSASPGTGVYESTTYEASNLYAEPTYTGAGESLYSAAAANPFTQASSSQGAGSYVEMRTPSTSSTPGTYTAYRPESVSSTYTAYRPSVGASAGAGAGGGAGVGAGAGAGAGAGGVYQYNRMSTGAASGSYIEVGGEEINPTGAQPRGSIAGVPATIEQKPNLGEYGEYQADDSTYGPAPVISSSAQASVAPNGAVPSGVGDKERLGVYGEYEPEDPSYIYSQSVTAGAGAGAGAGAATAADGIAAAGGGGGAAARGADVRAGAPAADDKSKLGVYGEYEPDDNGVYSQATRQRLGVYGEYQAEENQYTQPAPVTDRLGVYGEYEPEDSQYVYSQSAVAAAAAAAAGSISPPK